MKFYFRNSTPPKPQVVDKSCSTNKSLAPNKGISFSKPPSSKPPCAGPKQPYKKKKINFKSLKKDTINSLNEVEHFLCNFQNIYKYIKLYKILK